MFNSQFQYDNAQEREEVSLDNVELDELELENVDYYERVYIAEGYTPTTAQIMAWNKVAENHINQLSQDQY